MWPFRKRQEQRASLENPSVPLSDPRIVAILGGFGTSAAGIEVNAEKALGVPAIWCAVNFLSSTVASLPLHLYRKSDKGREKAEGDPLYAILHDVVNVDGLTSLAWRKHLMSCALLYGGRGYTFIEKNKAGRVMNLWPLDPRCVTPERRGGRRFYRYKEGSKEVSYEGSEIIDVPFLLGPDGISHEDPVQRLRNSIGLSLALEEYASKFFQNGGVPPLALMGPINSPAAAKRASTDITDALKSSRDEQRNVLVIPLGHELKPIGVDPDKSQMEAARRFQVEEVARMYNLPPVFLQDLSRGTFSNTEQQDLNLVKHTLRHWLELIEAELNAKLFSTRNRKSYAEFNADGLLRGDLKSRMESYAKGIQNAVLKPNEAREMENRDHDPKGNELLIQGATVPLGMQPAVIAEQNGLPIHQGGVTLDEGGGTDNQDGKDKAA